MGSRRRTLVRMRLVAILFIAIPLVLMGFGIRQADEQRRRMTSYVATQGRVVEPKPEVRVHTSTSGKQRSTTYTPVVRYRYEVGGDVYRSERVFAMSSSTSRGKADALIAQYPVGRTVTVYYDPTDPGQAFLVRRWEFTPYLFLMFPMIHLAIGMGLWFAAAAGRRATTTGAPAVASGGWYELPIRTSIRRKRRPWITIALVWYAVGIGACAHYFAVAERPYGTDALIATPVYFVVGLIPLAVAMRYWLLGRNSADARVFVDKREIAAGEWFNVRVEQTFYRHLLIESADVGLVLERADRITTGGKTRVSTSRPWEDWANDLVKNEQASPGRELAVKRRFTIPPDRPGNSPAGERGYPRHAWWVVVRVRIADAPDYEGKFAVEVKSK